MKVMRVLFLTVIVSLVFASAASARLQHHWRMDDGFGPYALDSNGIWSNGILDKRLPAGDPNDMWAPAEGIGGAIELTGEFDRVISAMPVWVAESFTVMAWSKPSATQGIWARLFTSWFGDGFYLGLDGSNNWTFAVNAQFIYGGALEADQWQHIAGVYDGTAQTATIYVNGTPYATVPNILPPTIPNQTVYIGIGDKDGGSDTSVVGFVDDAAIFDTALSTLEIQEIVADGVAGDSLNYWQATNLTPTDFTTGHPTEVTLSWATGSTPPSPITEHVLYYGTGYLDLYNSTDPNLYGDITTVSLPVGSTSYAPGFPTDSIIYWRVDEKTGSGEIARGDMWHFGTILTLPQIETQPGYQLLDDGETAEFEVTATNVISYQWCRGTPGSGTDLTDGGSYSGATSSTLNITVVGSGDEDTYYCKLTNTAGTVETDAADLTIKDLKGFWELNDNLSDSIGTNPGVLADPNFASGVGGTQGIQFNGDGVVEIADTAAFDLADVSKSISLSCWVKGSQGNTAAALISKMMPAPSHTGYELHVNVGNSGGLATFWVMSNFAVDAFVGINSSTSVLDGQWHHIAATYDGSGTVAGIKMYIDGVRDELDVAGGGINASTPTTNALAFTIGGRSGGTENLFEGQMDNVRVYNYALTPVDVGKLTNGVTGLSYCVEPPVLDWDGDCIVGLSDFVVFAADWLECGTYPDCYLP